MKLLTFHKVLEGMEDNLINGEPSGFLLLEGIMKLNNVPCIEADDILLFDPGSGLSKWANTISGSFTYPSGQLPCSIMINKGVDICSTSCHAWLGFPETVLYRYKDGSFGIGKFINTSEIPKRTDVLWAIGGMGLIDKYNPAEEGFSKFVKNNITYDYSDVTRFTSHTLIGVKNNKIYLCCIPSMNGSQVNQYAKQCEFEYSVMLDGGHISAINSTDIKINLSTVQGYAIQGVVANFTTSESSTTHQLPINQMRKKIILDAGHSPLVSGKQSPDGTYHEYEFNLDVVNRMLKLLTQYPCEALLIDYSNVNATTELVTLIKKINAEKGDICVSIHSNAYGTDFNSANGWEIFDYKLSGEGQKLAEAIHHEMPALGLTDRGIKDGSHLAMVRDTTMPCVLIETGFHTNQNDLAKLKSSSFRDLVARTYVKGILAYFNIPYIKEPTIVKEPEPVTEVGTLYRVIEQHASFTTRSGAERMLADLKNQGKYVWIEEKTK